MIVGMGSHTGELFNQIKSSRLGGRDSHAVAFAPIVSKLRLLSNWVNKLNVRYIEFIMNLN